MPWQSLATDEQLENESHNAISIYGKFKGVNGLSCCAVVVRVGRQ